MLSAETLRKWGNGARVRKITKGETRTGTVRGSGLSVRTSPAYRDGKPARYTVLAVRVEWDEGGESVESASVLDLLP